MPAAITSRRVLAPLAIVLLLVSALLPARYSLYGPPLHNAMLVLLKPLSLRLHALGSQLRDRPVTPVDRTLEQLQEEILVLEGDLRRIQEENRALRQQIAQLSGLQQRLGRMQYRPVFARVTGRNADPGGELLFIEAGRRDGLDVGMIVADAGASGFGGPQLVGRIVQVQQATAAVRPITAAGTLLRLELSQDPQKWTLFRAAGPDLLVAADANRDLKVSEGDVARLADDHGPDGWAEAAKFMLVGEVIRVAPDPNEPLLKRVEVQPRRPLLQLDEVMVLVAGDATQDAPEAAP